MEKFTQEGVDTQSEIPEELKRFYSSDPYEVLGVSHTATREEIVRARNVAQKRFHSDVGPVADGEEISKRINLAFQSITKGDGADIDNKERPTTNRNGRGFKYEPHDFEYKHRDVNDIFAAYDRDINDIFGADRRKDHSNKETVEEVENEFTTILGGKWTDLDDWLSRAKSVGITKERIQELSNGSSAQEIVKAKVLKYIAQMYKDGYGHTSPTHFKTKSEELKKRGLDLRAHLSSPEVKEFLTNQALNILRQRRDIGPDGLSEFIKSWSQLGADLDSLARSEPLARYVRENLVANYIERLPGTQRLWNNPAHFTRCVEEWRKAGFDTRHIFDSESTQKVLKKEVNFLIDLDKRFAGRQVASKSKPFVEFWTKAGWSPDQEIMAELGKR